MCHPTPHTRLSLTDTDRLVLEVASHLPGAPGPRERLIRERTGMRPIRYFQHLNHLLDHPHAVAAYPLLINRLRRVRDSRRTAHDHEPTTPYTEDAAA